MPYSLSRLPVGMALCCSDDGNILVCLGKRVNVFDVQSRERILSAHPFSHPSDAAFSPKGKALAVKNTSGRIIVLDPFTGKILNDFKNKSEGEGSEVLFSPDGRELISASRKGDISIRRLSDSAIVMQQSFAGEMIGKISHDLVRRTWMFEHHPIVRPGENWASPPYLTLQRWPFEKHKAKILNLDLDIIHSATLSPDASRICYVATRRRVGRWIKISQASDGAVVASSDEIKIGGTGSELAWAANGEIVGSVQSRRFVWYRASDLSQLGEVPCTYPSSICFLPGTDNVALGSWNASAVVKFNDIAAGKVKMR